MGARQRLRSMGVWVRDRGLVLQGVWRELVACRCPCRGWVIYGGVPVSARPGQRGAEKKGIDEEFVVNQIRSPWRHGQCYTWLEEWRTVAEEDESWMTRRRPCCERRERCDDGRSCWILSTGGLGHYVGYTFSFRITLDIPRNRCFALLKGGVVAQVGLHDPPPLWMLHGVIIWLTLCWCFSTPCDPFLLKFCDGWPCHSPYLEVPALGGQLCTCSLAFSAFASSKRMGRAPAMHSEKWS